MNRARNRQSMRRILYKQGYLKKIPNTAKFGSSVKKPERRWFVFGVIAGTDPYLEYYENENAIFDGSPINIIFLESIIRIVRDQSSQRYQNVFTLVLKDRLLSLVAPSRTIMFEWCRALESQFRILGLLDINLDGENDYVDVPGVTHRTQSRRSQTSDPSSPLLAENGIDTNNNSSPDRGMSNGNSSPGDYVNVPPKANAHLLRRNRPPGLELQNVAQPARGGGQPLSTRTDDSEGRDVYENLWTRNGEENNYSVPNRVRRASAQRSTNSVNPDSSGSRNDNEHLLPSANRSTGASLFSRQSQREEVRTEGSANRIPERQTRSYQRMNSQEAVPDLSPTLPSYQFEQPSPLARSPVRPQSTLQSPTSPASPTSPYPGVSLVSPTFPPPLFPSGACSADSQPFSVLPEKMRESLLGDDADVVGGWTAAPPLGGEAPPPYMPRGVLERGANKSLTISQMEKLQQQQRNVGGLKVVLKRIDCHHCLALVQCFGAIWIAGWNQAARPFLQTAFHVGDQLISINGQVVDTAKLAYKLIKQCNEHDKITLIVKRLPKAQIFSFRRTRPAEDLGIKRGAGTGEVTRVREGSLASQQGFPAKSQTVSGDGLCSWYITEVNHRPASLFLKDKEIEHRLNAVGLDISILVQPEQLITEFKKQLKHMKKYKDFLVN